MHPAESSDTWLEQIDHTGDAGIIVTAPGIKSLFERAAWGMFTIIADPSGVTPADTLSIEVEATDREALLVTWLSELNFRHITQHQLYSSFEVVALDQNRLQARIAGEAIQPRHTVHTEIKAVTYHGLEISQSDGTWRARIIFDM